MGDLMAAAVWILSAAAGYVYVMWRKSGEPLDVQKLIPTFVIGLVVAALAWATGSTFDWTAASLQQTSGWAILTIVVDQVWRQIVSLRKSKPAPAAVPPPLPPKEG